MAQKVIAWDEYQYFLENKLGGIGIETESDVFQLGRKRKNGTGRLTLNKCCVQYLGERGGKILLEVYANPRGGSERMSQIGPLLTNNLADGSVLLTDGTRGGKAWVLDNPSKSICHLWINHTVKSADGFSWYALVDNNDGLGFENLEDGELRLIEVSTQRADGCAGIFKMWLNGKRGLNREHIKGYVKEFQWRQNHSGEDLFVKFLEAWGRLETHLRNGTNEIDLEELLHWDYSSYVDYDPLNFQPSWTCPGCEIFIDGENWRSQRKSHKRGCVYYQNNYVRSFGHGDFSCACCLYPYHDSSKTKKRKAILPPRLCRCKKKKKIEKLWTCPCCLRTYSDTASSKWQHRASKPACREHYERSLGEN